MSDDVYALATQDVLDPDRYIKLFFSLSEESRAEAHEFRQRMTARKVDWDEPADIATRAQLVAITRWGIPDPSRLVQLTAITQPTFVASGDDDDRWRITREQPSP